MYALKLIEYVLHMEKPVDIVLHFKRGKFEVDWVSAVTQYELLKHCAAYSDSECLEYLKAFENYLGFFHYSRGIFLKKIMHEICHYDHVEVFKFYFDDFKTMSLVNQEAIVRWVIANHSERIYGFLQEHCAEHVQELLKYAICLCDGKTIADMLKLVKNLPKLDGKSALAFSLKHSPNAAIILLKHGVNPLLESEEVRKQLERMCIFENEEKILTNSIFKHAMPNTMLTNIWAPILKQNNGCLVLDMERKGLPTNSTIFAHIFGDERIVAESFEVCIKHGFLKPEDFISKFDIVYTHWTKYKYYFIMLKCCPEKLSQEFRQTLMAGICRFPSSGFGVQKEYYQQLKDLGVDVNGRETQFRSTPLMHAAQMHNLAMCRRLVADGADPLIRNDLKNSRLIHMTAYDIATDTRLTPFTHKYSALYLRLITKCAEKEDRRCHHVRLSGDREMFIDQDDKAIHVVYYHHEHQFVKVHSTGFE